MLHRPCFDAGAIRSWPLNDPLFNSVSTPDPGDPCFTAAKRASERLTSGSTAGFLGSSRSCAEQGHGRDCASRNHTGFRTALVPRRSTFCPSVRCKNAAQTGPKSDLVLRSWGSGSDFAVQTIRFLWNEIEPIEPENAPIGSEPGGRREPSGTRNPAIPGPATESRQEPGKPTETPAGGPASPVLAATTESRQEPGKPTETPAGGPASPLLAATTALRAALDAALAAGDAEGARRAMRALDALLGEPPTPGQDAPASGVKSASKGRKA
jgi:hypothetical protein